MDIWGRILAGVAAVVALELLLKFWEAQSGRNNLEWLRAALTARLSKHDAKV